MTELEKENYRTACEMLEQTSEFVADSHYDINDEECVMMFDLDNRLEIYTDCVKHGKDVEEAYAMMESMASQKTFVQKKFKDL